jgi:sulfur relay protein TusB/DsrH
MSRLIVLNTHSDDTLDKALKTDSEVVLMQDAVFFTNKNVEANNKLRDHKVYALESDVVKRGLKDMLIDGVELLDVDALVDLFFSGKTVINM